MITPFDGMQPAADAAHADWVLRSLLPPPSGGVRFRVPNGFEAVARIHHPLSDGRRWFDVAPPGSLAAGSAAFAPHDEWFHDVEGVLSDELADLVLQALDVSEQQIVHMALWNGWGWVEPGRHHMERRPGGGWRRNRAADRERADRMRPVWDFTVDCARCEWWGGRTMVLFDGPIDAIPSIGDPNPRNGTVHRQFPQWIWPQDRSWFVGLEIDDACTYVAGDHALIERIEALPLESVRVDITDPW